MLIFKTEKRKNRIIEVAGYRQLSLHVVLENIHDPHNVSAIFRTCDAAGVPAVSLVYNIEKFPKIGKKSSGSAFKWIEREKYKSVDDCYSFLRKHGFKIYASSITAGAKSLYELNLKEKCAIVLGNEHRGVSDEAAKLADEKFLIPMYGMVQSLNVSVATAVVLYEAVRQREGEKMYSQNKTGTEELEALINKLSTK
ncbi:MAG: RNA methyltransferase [Ignavibacteria bacterium CG2_30_36_16]|nr:RNA methyltransferase [Ignavibacteria bacterium]OIP61759.1 MAG: RNA methyltransferase [Ignavibacteria bacterium CG2_30_36_16]PJB01458.1 MAG: RNA methyltransferase [Ignavibacteria bacterium CG_4_9_14_3_um_filter_36_18]